MLLKPQFLSVSQQAAHPARQPRPVQNLYRTSHSLLQFLPQKLAEWIANNYAVELNVPPRHDTSKPWSTATLNLILQRCLVPDSRGINIHTFQSVEFESDLYCGLCAPGVTHSTWSAIDFGEEMSRWIHIHGVCIIYYVYMQVIFVVYTCTDLIVLTAGLFGNYPSTSILHWRA